jgi:hypothetical protein
VSDINIWAYRRAVSILPAINGEMGVYNLADEPQAPCGDCGTAMELVRPGKWQCNSCEAREAK